MWIVAGIVIGLAGLIMTFGLGFLAGSFWLEKQSTSTLNFNEWEYK